MARAGRQRPRMVFVTPPGFFLAYVKYRRRASTGNLQGFF